MKFVVDGSGAVTTAADAGSDLPDPDVVACAVRAFKNLTFSPPDDGAGASVVYTLTFKPDGSVRVR